MNDLKFFTNEPERDLYSRFATILKSNTQFFDILVGYFRTSGFFRMYKSLEYVDKIRVLVGLNVDNQTIKIIDQSQNETVVSSFTQKEGKEALKESVKKEFAESEISEEIEEGTRKFIDWVKSGKLEMRMYIDAPIHAKVYIMRKNPEIVPDTFGSVITGSSNFSEAGLKNNLEFNVELKDASDVQFALDKFEELWKDGKDIRETYIEAVENDTWVRDDITPYEIYLKTLYEFFKEELNMDKEKTDLGIPEGFLKLKYQEEAVIQARKKINAYGGVFISDVVGLGKTYICAMLANTFEKNSWKLIICPPVLQDYWKDTLKEFNVTRCDVVSAGILEKVSKKTDKYDYVFVDEAHRFRNDGTNNYALLQNICHNKKVILISATPYNNDASDIENEIYLFQDKYNGTINGIKNLNGFFLKLKNKLNKFEKGTQEYMQQLRKNAEVIRDSLLREVMVRRTRSEIKKYYEDDLVKQNIVFPKVNKPKSITYEFDNYINEAFSETIHEIKNLRYARFSSLLYLKDKTKYASLMASQTNMSGFMKSILVKRLESSFYAFKKTLNHFIESYEKFINMIETGEVYISKKYNVYDLIDDDNIDKLLKIVEKGDAFYFKSTDFNSNLVIDLKQDLNKLKYLKNTWDAINIDPKLDKFLVQLKEDRNLIDKKIIIFTESRDTAKYLEKSLKEIYKQRVVGYSSQSNKGLKEEIENSFNPKKITVENDKYDILITTDVLAEGINLHESNVIINYDLPWNPTRIMQRVGRINRIGTKHDSIFVYNFFPTAQSNKQLSIEDRILEKIQAFHDTLGDDIKYLSDSEDVSPKKLFTSLSALADEGESYNPELEYLKVIREVRDTDIKLFNKIKRLPIKAKTAKELNIKENSKTISFIRKGALKKFFISSNDNESLELNFEEAMKYLKANKNDKKHSISSEYYEQLKQNSNSFDIALYKSDGNEESKPKGRDNASKVIVYLKGIRQNATLTDEEENKINKLIELIEKGTINAKKTLSAILDSGKGINNLTEAFYNAMKVVPNQYFEENNNNFKTNIDKQVILSCYLINKGE